MKTKMQIQAKTIYSAEFLLPFFSVEKNAGILAELCAVSNYRMQTILTAHSRKRLCDYNMSLSLSGFC